MRSGRRLRVAAAVLAPLALAGCASTSGPAGQGSQAEQLLGSVPLPAGAVPLTASRAPTTFQSSDLGCDGVVERERYVQVPAMSIDAAQAWFQQHPPQGLRAAAGGSGGDSSGETMTEVDDALGSAGSRLVVMAVPDGNGSAVRLSAQIVPAKGCVASRYSDHGNPDVGRSSRP